MCIKVCTTDTDPPNEPFSWDTDGILFIIDNSATAIISNIYKLFSVPLKSTRVTMETAESISTHTKLVGLLRLVLTDNSNRNHLYIIPRCVYDPDIPLNILGVPTLDKFSKDSVNPNDELGEDGTTVKSGATKSHLIWDHGKHERHFLHGSRNFPELCLYVDNPYFKICCTCVHKLLSEKVHHAFSSEYSIPPTPTVERTTKHNVIPYTEGDLDDHGPYQWYDPASQPITVKHLPLS